MHHSRKIPRGFTLVELMISLGIAILLIYGINVVFRAVADTVRTGNAIASANRKMRSVESSVVIDFEGTSIEYEPLAKAINTTDKPLERRWSGMAPITGAIDPTLPLNYYTEPRQPAITIFCKRQLAFLNKADLDNDDDKNVATVDESDTGTETPIAAGDNRVGGRVHRVDTIGFFSGGSFQAHGVRDKGTSGGVAQQAWIWYGHALQHDTNDDLKIAKYDELRPMPTNGAGPTAGRFYQPGQNAPSANHRNYFASDWVLGRMAMMLLGRQNSTANNSGSPVIGYAPAKPVYNVFAESSTSETAIDGRATKKVVYASGSQSTYTAAPTLANPYPYPVDKAVDSLVTVPFTSGLCDVAAIWPGLLGTAPVAPALLPTGSINTGPTDPYDVNKFNGLVHRYQALQAGAADWWERSMLQPDPNVVFPLRFDTVNAFAKPVTKEGPLTDADKASLQATYLAKGCTQFIVEFAGDFVKQDLATGKVTSAAGVITPDGVVDFDVIGTGANAVRRTQWYGLPRDVNGDGTAEADSDGLAGGDVVPVFNKAKKSLASGVITPSFEQAFVDGDHYIVAFGPREFYPVPNKTPADSVKPSLIRLTVTLTDGAGSLPTGMTREFVFKVR